MGRVLRGDGGRFREMGGAVDCHLGGLGCGILPQFFILTMYNNMLQLQLRCCTEARKDETRNHL